jgi:hypothetical protein
MLKSLPICIFFVLLSTVINIQAQDASLNVNPWATTVKTEKVDIDTPKTTFAIDVPSFNFGRVKDGTKVRKTFFIKNTGENPLFIFDAKVSCGCTVPSWPKEGIAPGEMVPIDVVFDTTGKGMPGGLEIEKKITIVANADESDVYLSLRGFVEK